MGGGAGRRDSSESRRRRSGRGGESLASVSVNVLWAKRSGTMAFGRNMFFGGGQNGKIDDGPEEGLLLLLLGIYIALALVLTVCRRNSSNVHGKF